jgi:hypothetical protein
MRELDVERLQHLSCEIEKCRDERLATRTISVSKLIGHHCRDQQNTGCREEHHNTEHKDISARRDYSDLVAMSPD